MITSKMHGLDLSQSHEFLFIALTMLHQQQKTNVIPELMQILTPNQILTLVQVYSGQQLCLPTAAELSATLKASVFMYKRDFLHQPETEVVQDLELGAEDLQKVTAIANQWYSRMKSAMGTEYYKSVIKARDTEHV